MEPKTQFRTIITYVIKETGEVIPKSKVNNDFIITEKIKENATTRNGYTKIEWTYVLEGNPQLRLFD